MTGGLREMSTRTKDVQQSVSVICGIASRVTRPEAAIMSIKCLHAAREHVTDTKQIDAINDLLKAHQSLTGWPVHDIRGSPREMCT